MPPGGPREAPKRLPNCFQYAPERLPRCLQGGGAVRKGNALDHLRLQAWWDLASCEGAFVDRVWSGFRTNLFLIPMVPWKSDETMFVDLFV